MRVNWSEPPAPNKTTNRSKSHARQLADELRKHPKRWAKVATRDKRSTAYVYANTIKSAATPAWGPRGSFEAVSRTVDGKTHVWARYVGE